MRPRFNFVQADHDAYRLMFAADQHLHGSGLEHGFIHSIKLRASQFNGRANCIDMYWKDARGLGKSEQRLYDLGASEEIPCCTDPERAALAWTEAMNLIADGHVPDAALTAARSAFSDKELADLSWCIATINVWNRMAIGLQSPPGKCWPPKS